MNSRLKLTLLTLSLPVVLSLTVSPYKAGAYRQQPSLIVLRSSEHILDQDHLKVIAAAPSKDNEQLYAINTDTGGVAVYERGLKLSKEIPSAQTFEALAVGPQGQLYLADTAANQVRTLNSAGHLLGAFSVPHPVSLAPLSNGNVVVASSSGKLLYVHSPAGRPLSSFGELKRFDVGNVEQNHFLNRGEVVVGPSDTIYYVSKFAPTPTVQKFTREGQLLSEFVVKGDAISHQLEVAKSFLREKESHVVGGFYVITSATVDPTTGHLWISTNGTSRAGAVYEYDVNGEKLHEYAFQLESPGTSPSIITGVKDIIVRTPWIYILTWENHVYRFNVNNSAPGVAAMSQPGAGNSGQKLAGPGRWASFRNMFSMSKAEPSLAQLPCPQAQPLTCTASCRSGSLPTTQDCGAEVRARMAQNDIIIGGNCSNSAGPEPSCSASANTCNTDNGVRATISVSLTCNAPPPPSGQEGYGGTASCDIDLPPSCQDGIDNDGDLYIDTADPGCTCPSPVVIDTSGNGFDLSSVADGVWFDMAGIGQPLRLAWTQGDDAWLALDRNGNGRIDNGTELFGNYTPQPPSARPHGFLALAEYDKPENGGNGDGAIDQRDSIFASLRLWQDTDRNGVSGVNELHSLPSLDVVKIELDYRESKRADDHGNRFRYRAKVKDARGVRVGRWAWDVFLVSAP